jgi:hypothetical protein
MVYSKNIHLSKESNNTIRVDLGISCEEYPILNHLNYASNKNIALELKKTILDGDLIDGYDGLQTQQYIFDLYKDSTIVEDFIFDNKVEIPTILIFDFLEEYKNYINESTKNIVINDIIEAFLSIQNQPTMFMIRNSLYKIKNSKDIYISFALAYDDLKIDVKEFVNKLHLNVICT